MQYVGRLVSSVYNNITPSINPATLSGAIDVIVVERQVEVEVDDDQDEQDGVGSSTPDNRNSNGNSNNKKKKKKMVTELASTPFHVRFGKMSVLRPAERKVTLHLNNSPDPLPFAMKVGEAGEAFFVLELDDQSYGNESIPEDLVTSPILSAASSPTLSATEGQEGRKEDAESLKKDLSSDRNSGNEVEEKKEDEDLEPLDLGAAESSGPSLTGGTGTDKAQEPSPSQSQDQEEEEEEDARSGTTEIRSRSSRSRSQDTNVTTPTSGAERSLSPDSQTRSNSQATGEISKHSKAKGYDQDTSVPSKAQPDPTSNTAEQTGPLSSLSNAASRASGVVSAAGRAIISPVTTTADKSDPTADGSKNSKLENLVKKKSGDGDKAPIEKEDDEMKSNWNSKSSEGQDNGGITKGAKKQERDEKKKEKKEGKQDRNEKVEDENLIERTEAEELEFQMQKRALNLVKAEQEASSPNQSSSKNEDEERAPSSSLAQVEDSKSEKKDDDQPISNALLAEEPFPKPFGTSSVPSSAESQTHPVQPRTSKTLGKDDEDDEELRAYLENNQNRNPISSLGIQDSIPPMDSKTRTETYPVSQPDHEKYLAGTLLGKESVDVGNGEVREVDKVMLDERVVKRKIEKEKEEMKNGKEEEKKAEEKKLTKSPKIERREDLQYMLDIDGYKMTADGEDLAFAEGHRFANEMPLSKKHGGNGKKAKITRYEDSALADDDDEEDVEGLVSGKGKSSSKRRASFARSSRSGHRTSRSMSRNRNGRNGSTSLSRKEGNSTRRDFKTSLSGNSAMGHHLQARLRTRRSSSSLLDDLTHELSSGDERPVLGLGANDEIGGTVEKESLSLSRDLARLARITRDNHHQTHHNQASRHSRRSNLSEGNLTPTSLIARRRTRSTKISGGPLGAGPRNRAKAAHGGHFKEFSYSDTEAEVPALRQKARRSRGKNLRNESAGLTLVKGKARLLNEGGDSSVPNTPAYTSFPKDDSQSFETDQTDREDLEDGERTPPAHPDSSLNNVNQSPEYEWGWGSLPKKKAQDEKDRRARVVSLGGSRAIRPDLDDEDQDENQVSSYDTAAVTTNNEEDEDPELSIDAINKANEKPPNGKLRSDDSDPYLFRLELDDASHEFELSLCFDETFGTSGGLQDQDLAQERDDYNFEENKISFQRFVDDQEVVDDERLVVRYNSRYLTWESASAVLATLSLYRKTLSAAEMDGADATAGNDGALDEDLNNQPRPSVWSRWWNRKGVPSSASTSNLQTEPQELDASGKEKSNSPPTPSLPHSLDRSRTDSLLETSNLPAGRPAGAAPSAARIAKDKADSNKKTYAKTLRLTSDQLKSLNLKKGANTITFSVTSSYSGVATCTARIFFWESFHRVVVSDIDGTITKSDALGHVFTMMGRDWTHLGVAKLYTDIARNGYRIMYLTSRAIGQADSTRDYLKGIKQNNYQLPDGPVIMSPDRLMASLHREVILRKPEVFKMACLRDIARLFGADPRHAQAQPGGQWPGVSKESLKAASGIGAGGESSPAGGAATSGISQDSKPSSDSGPSASNPSPDGSSKPQQPGQEQESQQEKEDPESSQQANPTPFYAGFGNRITDALSYRSVNIPSSRIFTIDSNGEVKMELLELAGYKSSYIHMTDLVDQMFPPITSRQELNPDKPEYNDFNFWRPSVVDIELPADEDLITSPPVSPALSARSGKSLRSVRSNASLRSGTSDGSEYGHGRAQTEVAESGSTSSSSRLSRFGLGSLGLSRKSSAQTVANVPVSSRPTSSSSTNSTSTSVFTFPTGSSSSSYDQTAIPASSSAPDLTETWNGEDSTSSSPPSSYGRGVTGWSAPWRRSSRATSPSGTSNSGASGSQFRQATSPLVGPVITAEPEEDEDMAALSDDDVSNFGGDRDGNLDGKDGEENEREGSEDMGDDVLDQDEDGEEEELEEEEDDDPLLATGEIKFEWTK